ncbi:SIR2 family protein [Rhodobium gokarnense]|uniref:SIR2-like domain-containing protein n=1 Tax=Rhodobium gokarnense TaxID=364296 RepID=A0ABT3HF93_9HYPH|nr:SIR2 family protein [Rhodobium gokarnense]MCW2309014.1 hypothetical protein [Rhodobium gokarnense]
MASGDSDENNEAFFAAVREQLRYWPYTIHQIDDTLDIGLIEGRGKQLLFRAINARNLTAFAGSGLSVAYGRLGWREWQDEQLRVARRNARAFLDVVEKAQERNLILTNLVRPAIDWGTAEPWANDRERRALWDDIHDDKFKDFGQKRRHNAWSWLRSRGRALAHARHQVSRLNGTFSLVGEEEGTFPGGEDLPVKFEIAQQLHNELRRHLELFLPRRDEPCDENPANVEKWLKNAWSGALQDEKKSAPIETLDELKKIVNSRSGILDREPYENCFREFAKAMLRPEARLAFETLAKVLLVDECPHAMLLLRKGLLCGRDLDEVDDGSQESKQIREVVNDLERRLDVFGTENLKRDLDGIRERPERYRVLTPFRFDRFDAIRAKAVEKMDSPETWRDLDAVLSKCLPRYDPQRDETYLTPSSRFLVPVYLALCPRPDKAIDAEDTNSKYFLRPEAGDFKNRRSILHQRLDPLATTFQSLGIRRYVTTNYDFEIERFFQDHGYRNFPPREATPDGGASGWDGTNPDMFRRDGIGGELRDQTFTRSRAAGLTRFALENGRQDAGVYHLHGRATQKDSLVITERDYMNLYLAQDEHRDTVDEGISMVFSGAPLLFLGLGMGETDLLRPLRQFISNRDRTVGYTSIAFLPADGSIGARTKFASALYLRYGVHTIFYGSGRIGLPSRPEGEGEGATSDAPERGLDWLNRMLALTRALKKMAEKWLEHVRDGDRSKNTLTSAEDVAKHLCDALGPLGSDLASTPNEANDKIALHFLLGVDGTTSCKDLAQGLLVSGPDRRGKRGDVRLRTCRFSPTRPKADRAKSRHTDEDSLVDGEPYVGRYTSILNELLRMALKTPATFSDRADGDLIRDLSARIIALQGLSSAFITGSLNAGLEGLAREQRAWWKRWQDPPKHRIALFQAMPGFRREGPKRFVRHRVDSVITDLARAEKTFCSGPLLAEKPGEPAQLQACNRTGVRAFDTFIAAIACKFDPDSDFEDRPGPEQRILFTVAAHRGLGKGTFMSAFTTHLGLSCYAKAIWDPKDNKKRRPLAVCYSTAIFVNISFSPEIGSVYDMLNEALTGEVAKLEVLVDRGSPVRRAKHLKKAVEGVSRLAGLERMIMAFRDVSEAYWEKTGQRVRLLINISAAELLFDSNGQTKNGEIEAFLRLLMGTATRDVPMDVVFVGSESGLGFHWSAKKADGEKIAVRRRLDRDNLPMRAIEQVERRLSLGRIKVDEDTITPASAGGGGDGKIVDDKAPIQLHHIHFARPVSPISFLIDNFPVLAAALYLVNPPEAKGGSDIIDAAARMFRKEVEEGRKSYQAYSESLWSSKTVPGKGELVSERTFVWDRISGASGPPGTAWWLREHAERWRSGLADEGLKDILLARLKDPKLPHEKEWRALRQRIGSSRYSMTILLAISEHLVIQAIDPFEGGREAERFIRGTLDKIRNVGQDRRDDMVVEAVLDGYRSLHRIGDPELDCNLHLMILRHLGVIGSPTGSAVLVRLPEFRDYFERLGVELEVSRRRFVVRALTALAHRGLVFRLDPHPSLVRRSQQQGNDHEQPWPAAKEYRYALHRIVQRFAVSKLAPGNADPVEINGFAPTLYASMPSAGPRLSSDSYRFLRSLMVGLSQYPDVPNANQSIEPWLFTTRDVTVRIQALRAALSLARSNFSVAVVSRLAERKWPEKGGQKRGHLETYRVRLRWLIRLAWEVYEKDDSEEKGHAKTKPFPLRALYRDEIVWLYNELGVVSLAQGALTDALGFLRQAAEFNEEIEGRSYNGPIFHHIDLNHAIVQFERGQLTSSRTRLNRVMSGTKRRDCVIYYVAKGYQCLLDHVTGRFENLDDQFEGVINALQQRQATRAAAIFLIHRGRLLAGRNPKKSIRLIRQASELAETGGHEDVRQQCNLARVKFGLVNPDKVSGLQQEQLDILQEVEDYSRSMSIWSLQCDAQMLRASVLLRQGETTTAGRLLSRSMAVARRHSMGLRLNRALTLYAETLLLRGDRKGAKMLAQSSLEMAKSTGDNIETTRAQSVLSRLAI